MTLQVLTKLCIGEFTTQNLPGVIKVKSTWKPSPPLTNVHFIIMSVILIIISNILYVLTSAWWWWWGWWGCHKSHRIVCLGCCKKCTNSPNFVKKISFLRWHKRGKCCHQILWFFLGFTKFGEKSSELYFTKLCEAKYCDVFFTKFGEKLFTQFFSPKFSPIFFTKFGEKVYTPKIHQKNGFKNHKIWWKFGHKI